MHSKDENKKRMLSSTENTEVETRGGERCDSIDMHSDQERTVVAQEAIETCERQREL